MNWYPVSTGAFEKIQGHKIRLNVGLFDNHYYLSGQLIGNRESQVADRFHRDDKTKRGFYQRSDENPWKPIEYSILILEKRNFYSIDFNSIRYRNTSSCSTTTVASHLHLFSAGKRVSVPRPKGHLFKFALTICIPLFVSHPRGQLPQISKVT